MRKRDIVNAVVSDTGLSSVEAADAVESVFYSITESLLRGEDVFVRGFATIKSVRVKPKRLYNVNKRKPVLLPAQNSAKIKLCRRLKALMNG
ncbi:MAG: HU family DNA-binding protein [Rikenellaceae bacterium]